MDRSLEQHAVGFALALVLHNVNDNDWDKDLDGVYMCVCVWGVGWHESNLRERANMMDDILVQVPKYSQKHRVWKEGLKDRSWNFIGVFFTIAHSIRKTQLCKDRIDRGFWGVEFCINKVLEFI